MKYINKIFLSAAVLLVVGSGCKKYLDVNNDPNNPTDVEAALLLPPILQNFAHGIQIDNRYIGRYVQHWHYGAAANDQWDQHGYVRNTDRGGAMFRSVYWRGGLNMINMMSEARASEKWDYLGVAYALKAYGWQTLTDIHGEIIVSQAFTPGQTAFTYDKQDAVYMHIRKLCDSALLYLNRQDGKVSTQSLGRGDQVYQGNRDRWIKFVYGLLARNYNHLSKKTTLYSADSVISFVDKSFVSNADDAFTPSEGTAASDASPYGQSRSAISGEEAFDDMGQSQYAINLMNGTIFTGVVDPRMAAMLWASTDGVYRGLNPAQGAAVLPTTTRVPNFYGLLMGTLPSITTPSKFLWRNEAPVPIMTYAELQFIKAEAAFKKGDMSTAYTAFRNGVSSSLDFVGMVSNYSKLSYVPGAGTSVITPAQKTAYLASTPAVPASSAGLTLSHIMLQKWIALYGWGAHEIWVDMRRYDYDPALYTGFVLPTLFTDNNSKVVQRLRMRYNSEYVWNQQALSEIGGLDIDFHTKPVWFSLP